MAYSINDAGARIGVDSILAPFQVGTVIEIRDGVRPASNAAAVGVVLATIALPNTAFESAGTTTARTAGLIASANDPLGDANGSATWFRMYNTTPVSATVWLDGDVGALGSGADMELDDGAAGTAITTADTVTIATLALSL